MPPAVLITGSYGYLGSVLREHLEDGGWETTALVRSPRPDDRAVAWTLGEDVPAAALEGVDALVHCAYDLRLRTREDIWRVNVAGTARLLESARRAGVPRLLVLSSMSAYAGTTQLYGRAKLEIERQTLAAGGVAIRPGLVYGPRPGGMAGTLAKLTRLPVTPVLNGGARQFPVHQEDFARVVRTLLEAPTWTSEVFGVAQGQPISFLEVLQGLAALQNRTCRFVTVPWQLVYGALRVAEAVRVPTPVRSDSVAGLVRPASVVPLPSDQPDLLSTLRTLSGAGVAPAVRSEG
jgi:nucleoside-diphosphate-sugar epimerase